MSLDINQLRARLDELRPSLRNDFARLIEIPSISQGAASADAMVRSARAVARLLTLAGGEARTIERDDMQPAVVAYFPGPVGKPIVGLYAHRDVQPPGQPEAWDNPPFAAVEKDGRLLRAGRSRQQVRGHDAHCGFASSARATSSWCTGPYRG